MTFFRWPGKIQFSKFFRQILQIIRRHQNLPKYKFWGKNLKNWIFAGQKTRSGFERFNCIYIYKYIYFYYIFLHLNPPSELSSRESTNLVGRLSNGVCGPKFWRDLNIWTCICIYEK